MLDRSRSPEALLRLNAFQQTSITGKRKERKMEGEQEGRGGGKRAREYHSAIKWLYLVTAAEWFKVTQGLLLHSERNTYLNK